MPWAYILEGLLSGGYLHLRCGGIIFGRACVLGAHYRNFTILKNVLFTIICLAEDSETDYQLNGLTPVIPDELFR